MKINGFGGNGKLRNSRQNQAWQLISFVIWENMLLKLMVYLSKTNIVSLNWIISFNIFNFIIVGPFAVSINNFLLVEVNTIIETGTSSPDHWLLVARQEHWQTRLPRDQEIRGQQTAVCLAVEFVHTPEKVRVGLDQSRDWRRVF